MEKYKDQFISTAIIEEKQTIRPYHLLVLIYIFILILSNITAVKVSKIFGFDVVSSAFFFPLIYIISSIITEVYGFKATIRAIWSATAINFFCGILLYIAASLPLAPGIETNAYFDDVIFFSTKIFLGSTISLIVGDYISSIIIAKSKLYYCGKYIYFRFLLGTLFGISIDTLVFMLCIYLGIENFSTTELISMSIIIKFVYQLFFLPITCKIADYLKDEEQLDFYDFKTNFSLFSLK